MKKKLFCLLFALLLAFAAAGCGMNGETGRPGGNGNLLPEPSPVISPSLDDGLVQDQDGIIGNGDGGVVTSPAVSPSPSSSPMPSASPMPTTAPSASPKP